MATNTQSVVILFLTSILETCAANESLLHIGDLQVASVIQVRCYYCDNDRCREEEFCCGENICCVSYKVWELWYFWCGILFCLFLLSLCLCFWRQRSRAYWIFRPQTQVAYNLLTEEDTKYTPGRNGAYSDTKDRSLSPTFYGPSQKQSSWYSPHTNPQLSSHGDTEVRYEDTDTRYSDTDTRYDMGTSRKSPEY